MSRLKDNVKAACEVAPIGGEEFAKVRVVNIAVHNYDEAGGEKLKTETLPEPTTAEGSSVLEKAHLEDSSSPRLNV